MATSAEIQTLVEAARCSQCLLSPGLVPYVMLEGVRNISGGGGATFHILAETGDTLGTEGNDILRTE